MEQTAKQTLIYTAQVAEQSDRYEDMLTAMKCAVALDLGLEQNERNLLAVAWKNVVAARRYSWRIVADLEQRTDSTPKQKEIHADFKKRIETELKDLCNQVIRMLDEQLLTHADDAEAVVFYLKMKGDYCRYKAEILTAEAKDKLVADGKKAYEDALEIAKKMSPTNPVRLGLALNFSVFHYEILNDQGSACRVAKQAFDDAIAELDMLNEDSFKESTIIMQLLRDNLTFWNRDNTDDDISARAQLPERVVRNVL